MSYEIAATGLNAVNEQLDGISNNIANAGTVGYKSMTTQFSAMYAGSQAMGVSVAGTAQSISRGGSLVSTGNALDLAINDDGFVTCDSAGNISYTRAGSFETDKTAISSTPQALICRAIRSMTRALCKPVQSPISRSKLAIFRRRPAAA